MPVIQVSQIIFLRHLRVFQMAALGRMSAAIVHEISQPLAAMEATLSAAELGVDKTDAATTRRLGKARGLILPLALPEWRVDPRIGEIEAVEGGFQLRQSAAGRALYAPLLIDLTAPRMHREPTWRQLTVAFERKIMSSDVAVGYRAAIGERQWLIYRSLAKPEGRTVLGHNLNSEFMFGRFSRRGTVKQLLEIEG